MNDFSQEFGHARVGETWNVAFKALAFAAAAIGLLVLMSHEEREGLVEAEADTAAITSSE